MNTISPLKHTNIYMIRIKIGSAGRHTKKNEMTEWIERTYTYANTSDELIEARLLNIKQEQMEAQQKHNDYHKKLSMQSRYRKKKDIAQHLQDSIRHEKKNSTN